MLSIYGGGKKEEVGDVWNDGVSQQMEVICAEPQLSWLNACLSMGSSELINFLVCFACRPSFCFPF